MRINHPHRFKKIHATQMKLSEIRKQFHTSKFRDCGEC